MRRLKSPVLLTACLSLLAVQLGGLHMHVDADGNVGGPRGVHLHTQGLHSHGDGTHVHRPDAVENEHSGENEHADESGHAGENEHAGDSDISVTEMSAGKWKLPDYSVNLHYGLLVGLIQVDQVRPVRSGPRPAIRKSRWRPPLRAPPSIS